MKASAPGKLFLIGEYAVLEGAPATLTPADCRASVEINYDQSDILLMISDSEQTVEFSKTYQQTPLLAAALTTTQTDVDGLSMTLDTKAFFREGIKLGLGSSAALTAALIKVLMPNAASEDQLAAALTSHRLFQGDKGSGADIALAMADQPVVYRMNQPVSPTTLPADLFMLAIWSEHAASTTDFLQHMGDWKEENRVAYHDQIQHLSETADKFAQAIQTRPTSELVQHLHTYDKQLQQLSNISYTNLYDETHQKLQKQVELLHCTYKPSGAGGGDFGIAFSTNNNELINLADQLKKEGRYCFRLDHSAE